MTRPFPVLLNPTDVPQNYYYYYYGLSFRSASSKISIRIEIVTTINSMLAVLTSYYFYHGSGNAEPE